MPAYRGLTWDHPRGYRALRAAQRSPEAPSCPIEWHVQSLEGFESAPIAQTSAAYHLLVLDHPHLGEAVACGALQPLDGLIDEAELESWRRDVVGASFDSYRMDGRQWAIPLDAAAQVSVVASGVSDLPDTWDDALAFAREVRSALPLGGPHPFLTLCALALSWGIEPGTGEDFLPEETVAAAVETIRVLAGSPELGELNPIGVLEAMSEPGGPQYCPHIYGYAPYSDRSRPRPVRFGDAPRGPAGRGSVLGGTGIAITAHCEPDADLVAHLRWLMSDPAQRGFIPQHDGQPALRSAWRDDDVNAAAGGFYSATIETVERAWVRPRHAGAIAFQQQAADLVRDTLHGDLTESALAARLTELYDAGTAGQPTEETV